jgi:hypothetical protein
MKLGRRQILRLVLLAATLGAIGIAIHLSLDPKNYFSYSSQDRASWVHDTRHVVLINGLMLAEAVCAGAALFSPRPRAMWLRCFLGLIVLAPWALTVTPFVLHMPLYVLFHHLWVWLLILTLIFVALGSMLHQLLMHLRQSRLAARAGRT